MTDQSNNGLGNVPRLKQSAVRQAVASTVASCRNGWSDADMAEEWEVSASTVNNAQNKAHDLSLMNFLRLGRRFGPDGLNTTLTLIGMKAVQDSACCVDVSKVPVEVASVLPELIDLLSDGDLSDADVRALEASGAIDKLVKVTDHLRQSRDVVRLRGAA